jgi:hypothetical protein
MLTFYQPLKVYEYPSCVRLFLTRFHGIWWKDIDYLLSGSQKAQKWDLVNAMMCWNIACLSVLFFERHKFQKVILCPTCALLSNPL